MCMCLCMVCVCVCVCVCVRARVCVCSEGFLGGFLAVCSFFFNHGEVSATQLHGLAVLSGMSLCGWCC